MFENAVSSSTRGGVGLHKVKVTLQLTVNQSVSLGGAHDQIFITL
jgi:hypothetical protein